MLFWYDWRDFRVETDLFDEAIGDSAVRGLGRRRTALLGFTGGSRWHLLEGVEGVAVRVGVKVDDEGTMRSHLEINKREEEAGIVPQ